MATTKKTVLVLGGTGATGKWVVRQMLERGHNVRVIVRSKERLESLIEKPKTGGTLSVREASVLNMTDAELLQEVKGCDAIVQCLGHNLTFNGIFGGPRYLCKDTVKKMTRVVNKAAPSTPIKYVVMGTVGVDHPDGSDKKIRTFGQNLALALFKCLLPPHRDNIAQGKAVYKIGTKNPFIEWSWVRPDSLINEDEVTNYVSPVNLTHSLFDPQRCSRINVAHFMCELVDNQSTWSQFKFKFPVIYNADQTKKDE